MPGVYVLSNEKFQSHTGSIQRRENHGGMAASAGFQSHTGSIQRSTTPTAPRARLSFNPTLVRFNDHRVRSRDEPIELVSIPHWFDSTTAYTQANTTGVLRFQSH